MWGKFPEYLKEDQGVAFTLEDLEKARALLDRPAPKPDRLVRIVYGWEMPELEGLMAEKPDEFHQCGRAKQKYGKNYIATAYNVDILRSVPIGD